MVRSLPRFDRLSLSLRGKRVSLPYFCRVGTGGPAILFVHGLGGAKENFYAALQSRALADCTVVSFDQPGTGLSEFDPALGVDVSDLADLAQGFADALLPGPYYLAGASMGGLINLLQIRRYGPRRIRGLINIEGNLASEDCMFSRRVVPHALDAFQSSVFPQMIDELRDSSYAGDQTIAHNLTLNVDVRAYHAYSFQTVSESDSGCLLEDFIQLRVPRLFLHGAANHELSYLQRLREAGVQVTEIPRSAHFLFYDNPVATFQAIGAFVHSAAADA